MGLLGEETRDMRVCERELGPADHRSARSINDVCGPRLSHTLCSSTYQQIRVHADTQRPTHQRAGIQTPKLWDFSAIKSRPWIENIIP